MEYERHLAALRALMAQEGLDYLILNTNDDHLTESPCLHWGAVRWLCGFTGSLAEVAVAADALAFWTDSRYTVQARRQVTLPGAQLYDIAGPGPTLAQWLGRSMGETGRASMAYDGRTFSDAAARKMILAITDGAPAGISVCSRTDLLDGLWENRPALPRGPVFQLELRHAGASREEKLGQVRGRMAEAGAGYYLLTALDDIAWLTNLRGTDYPVHPLFPAHMLVAPEGACLFTDSPLGSALRQALAADGITVLPEGQIARTLGEMQASQTLYYDPQRVTRFMVDALPPGLTSLEGPDIVRWMKARKNGVEIANLRQANRDEGIAICRALMDLECVLESGGQPDEADFGQMIEGRRGHSGDYVMAGNIPIVGYRANGALPHYRPVKGEAARVQPEGVLLFDVVGHYRTGSTDISRTVALGPVSEAMQRDYTAVLKAVIALARQRFPAHATGAVLDGVARSVLWNHGRDYGHGTGHGIGYCLTVHEGPQIIGPAWNKRSDLFCHMAMLPGMVMSNEPGIYHVGEYGIRLENNVAVQEDGDGFHSFETLTLCPFDRRLIVADMLEPGELGWLNAYHRRVYARLSPRLHDDEKIWLEAQTAAL